VFTPPRLIGIHRVAVAPVGVTAEFPFVLLFSHVHAVYVVDRAVRLSDLVPIDMLENAFIDEGKAVLANAEPILGSATSSATTALLKTERAGDDVAHAIVRAADHWHADLVVMGTHGRRGMARWALGSVAQRVAQLTSVPHLLVHSQEA